MTYEDAEKVKQAAYVMSQSACAVVEALGMAAENQYRQNNGIQVAHDEEAFLKLIEKYGIHHNAVVTLLNGG